MKKISVSNRANHFETTTGRRKLELVRHTVRPLSNDELADVHGGYLTSLSILTVSILMSYTLYKVAVKPE